MRFVALNHYKDNSLLIGDFEPAFLGLAVNEARVSVTNAGITFFLLPRILDIPAKLKFAALLHEKLILRFGEGLSAAIGAEALNVPQGDFVPFYTGIKKIAPSIRNLHCGLKWHPVSTTDALLVDDHITDLMPQRRIIVCLCPSADDKKEPLMGWEKYENSLFTLFAQTEQELEKSLKILPQESSPSRKPLRPQGESSHQAYPDVFLKGLIPTH